MYNRTLLFMKVNQARKNRLTPSFYDTQLGNFVLFYISSQRSTRYLCNKNNFVLFFILPTCDEMNYIGVFKRLYQVYFFLDPGPIRLW